MLAPCNQIVVNQYNVRAGHLPQTLRPMFNAPDLEEYVHMVLIDAIQNTQNKPARIYVQNVLGCHDYGNQDYQNIFSECMNLINQYGLGDQQLIERFTVDFIQSLIPLIAMSSNEVAQLLQQTGNMNMVQQAQNTYNGITSGQWRPSYGQGFNNGQMQNQFQSRQNNQQMYGNRQAFNQGFQNNNRAGGGSLAQRMSSNVWQNQQQQQNNNGVVSAGSAFANRNRGNSQPEPVQQPVQKPTPVQSEVIEKSSRTWTPNNPYSLTVPADKVVNSVEYIEHELDAILSLDEIRETRKRDGLAIVPLDSTIKPEAEVVSTIDEVEVIDSIHDYMVTDNAYKDFIEVQADAVEAAKEVGPLDILCIPTYTINLVRLSSQDEVDYLFRLNKIMGEKTTISEWINAWENITRGLDKPTVARLEQSLVEYTKFTIHTRMGMHEWDLDELSDLNDLVASMSRHYGDSVANTFTKAWLSDLKQWFRVVPTPVWDERGVKQFGDKFKTKYQYTVCVSKEIPLVRLPTYFRELNFTSKENSAKVDIDNNPEFLGLLAVLLAHNKRNIIKAVTRDGVELTVAKSALIDSVVVHVS